MAVKLFLEAGMNPNYTFINIYYSPSSVEKGSRYHNIPLVIAIKNDNFKILHLLLRYKASYNKNYGGYCGSVLDYVYGRIDDNYYLKAAELFIKNGANVNVLVPKYCSDFPVDKEPLFFLDKEPLLAAAVCINNYKLIKLIIKHLSTS